MNTIFFKLFVSIIILFIIVILPLGFTTNQIFINSNQSHLRDETKELVMVYSNLVNNIEDQNIDQIIHSLSKDTSREIIITDTQGSNIIGNSGISGFANEEVPSAIGTVKLFKDTHTGEEFYYSSQLIDMDVTADIELFLFTPVNTMHTTIDRLKNALLLSSFGALLLAFGFTIIVSKKISLPLQKMERAAREIAKGNLELTLPVNSKDELGSLSRTMNRLVQDLKQYRLNRQEFFSDVSHELRTPLSYLKGYSEALNRGLYENEKEKEHFIKVIWDEAQRMNRLINDLFELSRMEAGHLPLELEFVNIKNLVEETVLKFKGVSKEKNIKINVFLSENNLFIVGDSLRLEQIIRNLLQNALRYTQNGYITVTVLSVKKAVLVKVSDTGIGINLGELPYIFDRFYRVEKSRSRDYGGTGLGLAIVKQLTELQYGTINVESELGKGTSFTLSFPEVKEEDE